MVFIHMASSLIIFPEHHNGVFSKSYLGKIAKKQAFFKIYQKNKTKKFNRNIDRYHQIILKRASELKLTPRLLYSSENITINEFIENRNLVKRQFFKAPYLQSFNKKIKIFHKIEKTKIPTLYSQIIDYKKTLKKNNFLKIILNHEEDISKYINLYKQENLCHGDLHFKNMILSKKNIYFIDLDYICVSSRGYDIAVLAYQEKLSLKKIKELSFHLEIDINEIKHYEPICLLLDYLWQEVQIELKIIKKNTIRKKIIKNFLKSIS